MKAYKNFLKNNKDEDEIFLSPESVPSVVIPEIDTKTAERISFIKSLALRARARD